MARLCFVFLFVGFSFLYAVPERIEKDFKGICWNCYNSEVSIHNFLQRYRETLRSLCNKKDARACHMLAEVYMASNSDIDAEAYLAKACKFGIKEDCIEKEEEE